MYCILIKVDYGRWHCVGPFHTIQGAKDYWNNQKQYSLKCEMGIHPFILRND